MQKLKSRLHTELSPMKPIVRTSQEAVQTQYIDKIPFHITQVIQVTTKTVW